MTDLGFETASALTEGIRTGRIGSSELLEHLLARLERLNPDLRAVVATNLPAARDRARAADAATRRGECWGPLHGLPMTIKDSIEVAGMPTTSGAPVLRDHVPERNAPAVQRLLDAGAIVFGKTNLPLYAGDFQSYNEVYGTTNNPGDASRTPGGSSGGAAAAMAAGLTPLELGSDIGGSIRNPAHYCGVYGHKPSYGLVPGWGHIPGPPGQLALDDLAVLGPLARAPQDLELALDLIAGPNEWESPAWRCQLPPARAEALADFRVAVWQDDPRCPVDREVGDALENAAGALRRAGVRVDPAARPELDPGDAYASYLRLLYGVLGAGFPSAVIRSFEKAVPELAPEDETTLAQMMRGAVQSHRAWLALNEARQQMRARWRAFFGDFDVLLCPVMPTAAFPHDHGDIQKRRIVVNGEPRPYLDQIFWAGLATSALLPATAAPLGLTDGGLPVGVQIVGPYLEDRTPLRFAKGLERILGGFTPPPNCA